MVNGVNITIKSNLMPNPPIPAAAAGLLNCPVAPLAHEIQTFNEAFERVEMEIKEAREAGVDSRRLNRIAETIENQRYATMEQVTWLSAKSAVGALLHLHLIANSIESIVSELPIEKQHEVSKTEKAIERMIYSVATFIESATGAKAEDACGNIFMRYDWNPHALIVEALERITDPKKNAA